MNRQRLTIAAASILGAILGWVGLIRISELRVGPFLVGVFIFFLFTGSTALLVHELIQANRRRRPYPIAYTVLLFLLGIPLLTQLHMEVGRSFIGGILWLIPPLKFVLAYAVIGALLLLAIMLCCSRKIPAGLLLLAASIYLAILFPLTARWANSLLATQMAINDQRGKEIGHAIRQFHTDHNAYPQSLSQLRPRYLQSIPWWWDGLFKRPYILINEEAYDRCLLKYCSEIGTGRLLGMDDLEWSTDAL